MIEILLGLLLLVFAVISIIFSIPHILQMQISEYLLFKYRGMIKESGYIKSIIPLQFGFPAKSPRNILIAGFLVLFQMGVAVGIFLLLSFNYLLILTAFPVFWLSGKIAVLLGVLLTTPLAWLVRTRFILIAKRQLKRSDAQVIGITGSYGKSTVKEILFRALSRRFLTGKTRGNRNTDVGIALEMALQVTPTMEYFIAEMGAYTKGDIKRLSRLYRPKYSILTGVGNQHLSLFGTRERIKSEKIEILKGFARNGVGYLNADIEDYEEILRECGRSNVVTYGLNKNADASVTEIAHDGVVTHFTLKYKGKKEKYETLLLGSHNIVNSLPAILLAKELGMKYKDIREALADIQPILGKLSIQSGINEVTVVNDSYNSNLNGFIAAIEVLKEMPQKSKYMSTWGVLELGTDKEESYTKILNALKGSGIHLITVDKLFASLGVYENVSVYESEESLLNRVIEVANSESVLLLEGRHSPEFLKTVGIERAY
jgi:UDP-N-acetylmuramoyl-tripeptide--D-alanyl-D-alanine ligase